MQIYKSDLAVTLGRINKLSGRNYTIESFSPGDGATRYRLELDGQPAGRYSLGRGNFYDVLAAVERVLEHSANTAHT